MATPLKRQFEVVAGTVLKVCNCSGCGGRVQVMVSKSGAAYYNCYNSDENAQPCQHHERWGGHDSRDMRREHLVKVGAIQPVKTPPPANLNRPPVKAVPDQAKPAQEPKQKPKESDDYGLGL